MKILITAPSLDPTRNISGIATVVQSIIRYNTQHEYYHFLLGKPDKKQNKILRFAHLLRQLALFPYAVRHNQIDLVHQNIPLDVKGVLREYVINLWCRVMNIPVVLHIHGGIFLMNGTDNRFYKTLVKSLLSHCKQVIVLSDLEQQSLAIYFDYYYANPLVNSVNIALFPETIKDISGRKPVLLFFGRIYESKGVYEIIEAIKLLKKEIDFQFIACGGGPLKDLLVDKLHAILGNDFTYKGIVAGEQKLYTFSESDVFLLPSNYGEGLPMALLETMAAGLVPLVTDDASMKIVVTHNVNGVKVRKYEPNDIYIELKRILSDPELFEKLSRNARKTIVNDYNIKNFINQLNAIYSCELNLLNAQKH